MASPTASSSGAKAGATHWRAVTSAATLARHGLTAGQYLLLVGSLKPNKNLDMVARALSAVPDLPWTVAVAGAADARIFRSAGSRRSAHEIPGVRAR